MDWCAKVARYYGTIQGARGPASRLGHANSGLNVTAQSYTGDIVVNLMAGPDPDDTDPRGVDMVSIYARPHGGGTGVYLYFGPIKYLVDQEGHNFLIREFAKRALKKENDIASE
jgi:hypothetical protein